MPLTAQELEDIREVAYAEDVDVPEEALRWTKAEAAAFFESGGMVWPSSSSADTLHVPPPPLPVMPSRHPWKWRSADATPMLVGARHEYRAHTTQISKVRLFHDVEGVVAQPGELLAVSGSWDNAVGMWRICSADGTVLAGATDGSGGGAGLCNAFGNSRWVYDVAVGGYMGEVGTRRLAVISTHTGGMVGEPNELICLWGVAKHSLGTVPGASAGGARQVGGAGAGAVAACTMFVNTEGSSLENHLATSGRMASSHSPFAHMRGVHAIDCSATHMVIASEGLLVAWP